MADAAAKKGGDVAALVLGKPEEEPTGSITKDAAIDGLMDAFKSGDTAAAKEALQSFVEACMDEYG